MARLPLLTQSLDHARAGRWAAAEAAARAVAADFPADPEALFLLGLSVAAGGNPERAAPALTRVAELRPNHAHPCEEVVDLLAPELPVRLFRACLRLSPGDQRLRESCATWLLDHDDARGALGVLRDGSETPTLLYLAGMASAEAGDFLAATDRFQRLTRQAPENAGAWSNLGMMLKVQGRHAEAMDAHDRAVALAPDSIPIRVNRGVTLLHAGRWREAWADYDARLRAPDRRGLPLSSLLPNLDRIGDLTDVTILATHEDGFGDTLHFMRYLPLLAERGARVLAWVPETLIRVVARLPGVTPVAAGSIAPAHDFHCPMFSLPRAFASTPETVPQAPYLTPDPALVARWSRHLPPTGDHKGCRVGLVWAGQARPWLPGFASLDRRRGLTQADFAPLAVIPGVTLVCLQAGGAEAGSSNMFNPMPGVRDFADTAAIIANLDLVISVDTSVVHLAGALGKRVIMLDRYDNCWRWLHGRADSPWYPSLTIFRQEHPLDWSVPLARMVAAVAALAAYEGAGTAERPARCPLAFADAA